MVATIGGMSWARGAIFYGSDAGKIMLKDMNVYGPIAQMLPPLVIGTVVQVANMPIVRATITIQDPSCELTSVRAALVDIYKTKGFYALYHGCSAAVMKTVPKYMAAIWVKDYMEEVLPAAEPNNKGSELIRSAIKSVTAGIAGAVLTNPLDVLRNEMFKTDLPMTATFQKLMKEQGWAFMARGVTSNTTAVAVPIAMTIFFTDYFIAFKNRYHETGSVF